MLQQTNFALVGAHMARAATEMTETSMHTLHWHEEESMIQKTNSMIETN
jgi:hypothetical protein